MAGLVPFNKKNKEISTNTGFEDFYNVLDDYFSNDWPFKRTLTHDTFKVDVEDNGNEYLIEAEVPGIDKKDINVELNDGKLMITITRDENSESKKKNFIHRERRYSSMSRSIYLEDAKPDGIKAKLENGLLKVVVPKEEKPNNSITIDVE
ncbi:MULTISPECIES: Hsp20/alpha crystallin family protein [Bacillota]|uniref:HSP20 family protein n=2 Tax=Clostridium algidicarnis TaxID=37659 RepID=A0A2S6FUG6_9CLOT|nr:MULTISPECIES: Hsp20/alpha crystallin family protein [Bacillota]ALT80617.1 heat-shock protein Hsp20 [Streptococcus gallolyticus]MBB6630707.1 Hsp20/alpha crystallin family protein [Clostridium algidicarnis]MBU3220982.1 Hsp20/alpha crystallin family protein [Clostridium algidicarnis]MCB2288022.1 Hsp20/alpha crystallin family protein [Clostridium algidicarnis]PPK43644.1 HSP20 family protein [Clostridium algidicarnis DSM 15099]